MTDTSPHAECPAHPAQSQRLGNFISSLQQLHDSPPPGGEAALVERVRPLLAELVRHDDWLPESCAQTHPQYYQQHLLHLDAQDRFSVVSFVWGPGQMTPIHDHTVWGLVGLLRGAESGERFARVGAGLPMRSLGTEVLAPGDVEHVSPVVGDIHRVANALADRSSISIHVYGGNIGRISRHVFDPLTSESKSFVSGYSSAGVTAPTLTSS